MQQWSLGSVPRALGRTRAEARPAVYIQAVTDSDLQLRRAQASLSLTVPVPGRDWQLEP